MGEFELLFDDVQAALLLKLFKHEPLCAAEERELAPLVHDLERQLGDY